MYGDGLVYRRGKRWWIRYSVHDQRVREPGGKTEAEARRRLRARIQELRSGTYLDAAEARLTVNDLLDALVVHLEVKGAKSAGTIRSHLKPVRDRFGHLRACEVTTKQVETYAREQLAEGYARATVNRQIQPLQQAFNLARKQGTLTRVPYMPRLREVNIRQGFFEHDDFEVMVAHLPDPIADVARFAYLSGWRKEEILSLKWDAVDRKAREVRLRTSKNGHGRLLPLEDDLWTLIERRWEARRFNGANGVPALSEWVFHIKGRRTWQFDGTWRRACRLAGVDGKLFHDLRRTAVRNMVRAGVPQSVAMAISGHRTVSMFLRYNITSEDDMRQAVRKVAAHVRERGSVVPLETKGAQKGAHSLKKQETEARAPVS